MTGTVYCVFNLCEPNEHCCGFNECCSNVHSHWYIGVGISVVLVLLMLWLGRCLYKKYKGRNKRYQPVAMKDEIDLRD